MNKRKRKKNFLMIPFNNSLSYWTFSKFQRHFPRRRSKHLFLRTHFSLQMRFESIYNSTKLEKSDLYFRIRIFESVYYWFILFVFLRVISLLGLWKCCKNVILKGILFNFKIFSALCFAIS